MKQKLTFKKFYDEYGVLLILLVMVAIFSFATPTFLTGANIINISKQVAIMAILSVGMTLVLVSGGGGIELSMGSVISLVVVLISKFVTERGFSVAIALILAVLVATALGFIDGVIIAKIKVPPLIMTLGMQIFLYGFTYSICEGKPVYGIPASLTWIGQTYLFKVIPVSALLMVVIVILGQFFVSKMYIGRSLYAVGSNEETADLSGISSDKFRIMAYTMCGFLVGIAGIVMLGRIGSGQPSAGEGYEMDVLTGCVLGGVSLNGGKGSIVGTFGGVLAYGILNNILSWIGLGTYTKYLVQGIVFLFIVWLNTHSNRKLGKA